MAAETASDITPNPWRLLKDELEFVAAYTKSIDTAKELLRRFLCEWAIRWRCVSLNYGNLLPHSAILHAHPAPRAQRFFWDASARIDIDWSNSYVTRTSPPWAVSDPNEPRPEVSIEPGILLLPSEDEPCPIYLRDQPEITLAAFLVSLHHEDVEAMLRCVGLLPPLRTAPPLIEQPPAGIEAIAKPTRKKLRAKKPLAKEEWLERAKKEHPRRLSEGPTDYGRRLLPRMEEDFRQGLVKGVWEQDTLIRRLYDKK